MLYYCLKYKNNTESKHPIIGKTKNRRMMLLSNCVVYDSKKLRYTKEQQASRILSNLGLKVLIISDLPDLLNLLFQRHYYERHYYEIDGIEIRYVIKYIIK